ncbi:hypothetical protein CVT24_004252 [Panaeolus cyanescens]|uniref:Uncharacterized protein n=1 Tax=Panaeolus cyanescens TaxID=181874 RepID=A0A409VA73_9AGAR|nr:hypothetical protein CVT24_004252 [Panaeolus cyanescens]
MAVEDIPLPPSRFATNLQLTARRVRIWIRPLLYRVFEYTSSIFPFPDFETRPHIKLEDVGRFARHLAYRVQPREEPDCLINLLRNCGQIINLAIWDDFAMLVQVYPALASLSGLRRLSAGFRGLNQDQVLSPVFLNLTHLDLFGNVNWDLISQFKNLTHLSIADPPHELERVLHLILDSSGCSSLRVVTLFDEPVSYYDLRLVVIRGYYDYLTDWIKGANGRMDSWTFAERIVIARENTPPLPIFPLELERIIFETVLEDVYQELPPSHYALSLQLVAKRVQHWIRPLLYRVYKYPNEGGEPFPDFAANRALNITEIGPLIKHLLHGTSPGSWDGEDPIINVMRHCPSIENLATWCNFDTCANLYPFLSSLLNIKRFSTRLGSFTRDQLLDPFMFRLTHLEVVGFLELDGWTAIAELKSLTHLSTSTAGLGAYESEPVTSLLRMICAPGGCSKLQVLKLYGAAIEGFDDIRIVLFPLTQFSFESSVEDWMAGATGRPDSWSFADQIVYARKMGYITHSPGTIVDPFSFNYREELTAEGSLWWEGEMKKWGM